jgi:ribosome-associated translation inhibitor RaiA
MSDKLQRLLEKAKTKRRNRPDTVLNDAKSSSACGTH